jgi:hypothetical protein
VFEVVGVRLGIGVGVRVPLRIRVWNGQEAFDVLSDPKYDTSTRSKALQNKMKTFNIDVHEKHHGEDKVPDQTSSRYRHEYH